MQLKSVWSLMKKFSVFILPVLFFVSCELGVDIFEEIYGSDGTTAIDFINPTNNQSIPLIYEFMGSAYDEAIVKSVSISVVPSNSGEIITSESSLDGGRLKTFKSIIEFPEEGFYYISAESLNELNGRTMTTPFMIYVQASTNIITNTNNIVVDTNAPSVSILSPTNLQKVGSSFTLSGTAFDNESGISTVYTSLDEQAFTEASLSGSDWSVNVTVSVGIHTNYAYAVDLSNNVSITNSVIVEYEAGLPFVTIDSPLNGSQFTSPSVDISGSAGVDSGSISIVELSTNSSSYFAVTGTDTWNLNSMVFPQGSNTIIARTIADNNKTNFTSEIQIFVDSIHPTADITYPSDGLVISNTSIQITGTAVDSGSGIDGVYIAIDDDIFSKFSQEENWTYTVSLPIGLHTIKVYSVDKIGHHSDTNEVSVTMSDAFIVYLKLANGWSAPPKIHYWAGDCGSTTWPGENMTLDSGEGDNWYSYTFTGSSTSIVFNDGAGNQTGDLTRNRRGYYWTNNQWYDSNPEGPQIPVISVDLPEGLYTNAISVALESLSDQDTIYYTLNGTTPTTGSFEYSSPIPVNTTLTIKAFGVNVIDETGDVYTFDYTIDPTADLMDPWVSNDTPTGHHETATVDVSFTYYDNKSATTTVYYTTDGNEATTSSAVYSSGNAVGGLTGSTIQITETTVFNLLIVDGAGNDIKKSFYYHMGDYTATRLDPRQETIYFLLTSRWYDGDLNNSVGDEWCSYTVDRVTPGSPEYIADNGFTGPEDVTWRGDFKGLVEKMDYIKALGFTAIWINPVVQNRSPLCYHGYHAWDMYSEDDRLESAGYDFQRVIDEAHERGMKICLDIVLNHSGRFGLKDFAEVKYNTDPNLYPDPDVWTPGWEYDGLTSPGTLNGEAMPPYSRVSDIRPFDANDLSHYPYLATDTANGFLKYQWPSSESYCKTIDGVWEDGGMPGSLTYTEYQASARRIRGHNTGFPTGSGSFDNFPDAHFDSCHEDCPDLNIENSDVEDYLLGAYKRYISMGVDMFRVDTVMHMHKQTLNDTYWPELLNYAAQPAQSSVRGGAEFFIFGEVANFVMTINDKASELRQQNYTWMNGVDNVSSSMNHLMDGNEYRTTDYSQKAPNGSVEGHVSVIDMVSHNRLCDGAGAAYNHTLGADYVYNDATYLVWYADSHDYGPNKGETRYGGNFAEFWSMAFTHRGIPVVYYGSEIRFAAGLPNDWPGGGASGVNMSLEKTGRSYFGDHLEGTVTATDFGEYTASGEVATTLSSDLSTHLRNLNKIRLAVPALQMGQYSTDGGNGGWANYKRRYDGDYNGTGTIKSYCLVGVGSGSHSFSGVLDGSYYDIVTGNSYTASGGSVSFNVSGDSAGLGVLVYQGSGFYVGDVVSVHDSLESTSYFGN